MTDTTAAKVLFICRHNAVRSQLAEILATKISHGRVSAYSAGPEPHAIPDFIHQLASDLNGPETSLTSNTLDDIKDQAFDMIITLCDKSHAALPELASDTQHIRWDFHHADSWEEVRHLEMELADRLRLLFSTKHLI